MADLAARRCRSGANGACAPNMVDDPGHRKIHAAPVPLAGGFAVLTGILLPLPRARSCSKLGMVKISSAGLIVHGIDRRALELAVLATGRGRHHPARRAG